MKTNIFTKDKQFYRMLFALALPISLQNLITFAVNFADNLMVGKLGDTAISGVFMGNQIQTFMQLFMSGVAQMLGILAAQYWGKRELGVIRKIVSMSMRFALGVGAVLMLIVICFPSDLIRLLTPDAEVIAAGTEYLSVVVWSFLFFAVAQVIIAAMRSVENARVGMYISLVALVVNVSFNRILIFGWWIFPAMGIRGAALATLISRIVECAAAVIYGFCADKKLKLSLQDFLKKSDSALRRDFIHYGLPIMAGEVVWAVNTVTQSGILGHFTPAVITASSIAGNMNTLVYIWISGLASAVGVITGKTVGEGNIPKVKEYAKTTQALFLIVGFLTGAFIYALRAPFIALFDEVSVQASAYAMEFLTVLSVTIIGTCYEMPCLSGLVKAGGDTAFVFKNDTLHVFCIVLPSAMLAAHFGAAPWVVFFLLKIDQILKCIVAAVKVNRYSWIKKLTR